MSWGGAREGAGRPKAAIERKYRSIYVSKEEWSIMKPIINLIKKDNNIGRDLLNKNKEHKIMVKDAQFINLTDKDITIYGKNHTTITFPKSGTVDEACVDGCLFDIGKRIYTEVGNVPKPEENIFYIVPVVVAQQLPERDDLLVASNAIKNENGEIVGFTSLNII